MSSIAIRLSLFSCLTLVHANCGPTPTGADQPTPHPTAESPTANAASIASPPPPAPIAKETPTAAEAPATTDHGFTFGNYEQLHVAFDECDMPDMCEVEVKDLLTIIDAGDGAVDVKIEVTQDNGHSCSFVGILAQIDPTHWGWSDETQTCQVDLKIERGTLELSSDGCRETYCGARARLQGSFSLAGLSQAN